jgi:predicted anti-sigma-YlaC factor YlaD
MWTSSVTCERAREWVSLRVDGELSEFEGALLAVHLGRCDSCCGFALDVGVFTEELRRQPLEPVGFRVALPRPRRARVRVGHLTAAAVATAAVGLSTLAVTQHVGVPTRPNGLNVPVATQPDDAVGDAGARRAQLLSKSPRGWIPRRGVELGES